MTRTIRATDTSVDDALEQAAGVLALAGHEITDARVKELTRRSAHGELTTQELIAEVQRLLDK